MAQLLVKQLAVVDFNDLTEDNVCEKCGWWDWFCSDRSLVNRSKSFLSLAKRLNDKWGNVGLFLKNNCPVNRSTYDSVALQDSDGNNHFVCCKENGWEVYGKSNGFKEMLFQAKNVRELAEWLNNQELPK